MKIEPLSIAEMIRDYFAVIFSFIAIVIVMIIILALLLSPFILIVYLIVK